MDVEALAAAILKLRNSRTGHRIRGKTLVRQSRRRSRCLAVVGTINKIFAVVRYVCVVIDLVDGLIQLFLDCLTVCICIRIVGCIDDFLFESLKNLNCAGDCAFSNLHHAVAVLSVLVVLIQGTDLNTHTLGNCIAGSIICCAVDTHTRRYLLQALRKCTRVLIQSVQCVDCRHVVFYYHCHDKFLPGLYVVVFGHPCPL